jgi:hypothetical protein
MTTTYPMQVSHESAAEQAVQLYKQNVKYEDIAAHLKKIGYVSSRTRKPITGQAARWMVMEELKKRGESPDRNADAPKPTLTTAAPKDDTIWVTPNDAKPAPGALLALRQVLSLGVEDEYKLKLIRALIG